MSDHGEAISKVLGSFGKKAKGTGSTQNTKVTDAQAQSKRNSSKRKTVLGKAQQHIRDKWEALCALKGRGRSKQAQKAEATGNLLGPNPFDSPFWSRDVNDSYHKTAERGG